MAVLPAALCAALLVTLVTSKPLCISEGGDSAASSESTESNSSEEAAANTDPSQDPPQPETGSPSAAEETGPLGATDLLPNALDPSPATASTRNASNPEDPQTSADAPQLPDDPSQTPVGAEIPLDVPRDRPSTHADPVQVPPDTGATLSPARADADRNTGTCGTDAPQIAGTYRAFPKGAAPPSPPHVIRPTAPFSTAAPVPIPFSTALTGVPVCFTFQLSTPEPEPPRGDS